MATEINAQYNFKNAETLQKHPGQPKGYSRILLKADDPEHIEKCRQIVKFNRRLCEL